MGWLDVFRSDKKSSAQTAKERLQLVVAHRRSGGGEQPAYFPQLQQDLLDVLRKYIEVGDDAVQMEIEREGDLEVLELNITLPESRH
ncbi:MAG: cell division topological specificity factor MinE [Xanthomonadales bacterium]|nr:cell division topological specificity factor MinE [Xanthomonadales bacterium]|tara:strand:- start:521 stop:781 length:261 start_codon:yes stop_codon:yes gene_type:complete